MVNTKDKLAEVSETIDKVAREIYYSLSLQPPNSPGRANLIQALDFLGIFTPKQVGLSNSVLEFKNK